MDDRIIHGNADLVPPEGASVAVTVPADLFPERDELRDPELILASHAYRARLLATPAPVAPLFQRIAAEAVA